MKRWSCCFWFWLLPTSVRATADLTGDPTVNLARSIIPELADALNRDEAAVVARENKKRGGRPPFPILPNQKVLQKNVKEGVKTTANAVPIFLDRLEESVDKWVRILTPIAMPILHFGRMWVNLTMLFYGDRFRVLAFHFMIFRIVGYQKVLKYWKELCSDYRAARKAMAQAQERMQHTTGMLKRQERVKQHRLKMMKDMEQSMRDGLVTEEEAKAFMSKYRAEIQEIKAVETELTAYTSSLKALRKAVSFKAFQHSLSGLYAAVITSITASSFKRAGQITLAITVGNELRSILLDLFKPLVDPIGFRLELPLEDYVATSENESVIAYVTLASYGVAGALLLLFQRDPEEALRMTMALYCAGTLSRYMEDGCKLLQRRYGKKFRRGKGAGGRGGGKGGGGASSSKTWNGYDNGRPSATATAARGVSGGVGGLESSAVFFKQTSGAPTRTYVHILLAMIGFIFHGAAPAFIATICQPCLMGVIASNQFLDKFEVATVNYFKPPAL